MFVMSVVVVMLVVAVAFVRANTFVMFAGFFLACFLRHWFFYFALKCTQCLAPELFQIFAHGFKSRGIQLVQPSISRRPINHQLRLLQYTEVLRDRWPAH